MKIRFTLQTTWQAADIRAIRLMLKALLRRYGLKCTEITKVDEQKGLKQ